MTANAAFALRKGRSATTGASHPGALRRYRRPINAHSAFTLAELLTVLGLLALLAVTFVPALARTHTGSQEAQCLNNMRQMTRAWEMYTEDYSGKLVSAYPNFSAFTGAAYFGWCGGNAETGGYPGSYSYGGADPAGIQTGLLWSYVQSLSSYHCPTDHRIADSPGAPFFGQPILRSISMNAFLAGQSFGANPNFTITSPNGARDPNHPVYLKVSEMSLPRQTFVFLDEDQNSINDSQLLVDVGGSARLLDLPSRAHRFGYSISFADGHAEIYHFQDNASKTWSPTQSRPMGGYNDWQKLVSVTTHPL